MILRLRMKAAYILFGSVCAMCRRRSKPPRLIHGCDDVFGRPLYFHACSDKCWAEMVENFCRVK